MFTLGVIMDPLATINVHKDSTLAMLHATQLLNGKIYYILQNQIWLDHQTVYAQAYPLTVTQNDSEWFTLGAEEIISLSHLDILLQRKDPPFDMNYIYTTYLLEKVEQQGVLVCNSPRSVRDCNEKLFATEFPQCTPPTLVSSQSKVIKKFLAEQQDIILKPLDGMGGSGIFRININDYNINAIIETLTQMGSSPIMAQRYLPEIVKGDKRILLIDGEPIPYALARLPAKGETRANLAVGGTGVVQPLTERDYWICEQIAPELQRRGLYFVGLDVIGDYLTEINVTSPTGIRQIDKAQNTDIGKRLIEKLLTKLTQRRHSQH